MCGQTQKRASIRRAARLASRSRPLTPHAGLRGRDGTPPPDFDVRICVNVLIRRRGDRADQRALRSGRFRLCAVAGAGQVPGRTHTHTHIGPPHGIWPSLAMLVPTWGRQRPRSAQIPKYSRDCASELGRMPANCEATSVGTYLMFAKVGSAWVLTGFASGVRHTCRHEILNINSKKHMKFERHALRVAASFQCTYVSCKAAFVEVHHNLCFGVFLFFVKPTNEIQSFGPHATHVLVVYSTLPQPATKNLSGAEPHAFSCL